MAIEGEYSPDRLPSCRGAGGQNNANGRFCIRLIQHYNFYLINWEDKNSNFFNFKSEKENLE